MRSLFHVFTAAILFAGAAGAEVRVATGDALKAAVKKVNPEYNPLARQMKVSGDVEVEVRITESGSVADVKVVSGNALLSATVVKAVKDWKFTPFEEGGKPVEAVTVLKFSFKL